jgi:hypothetical protein
MTPSQSKIKTSVLSKTSDAGSLSFSTLAFKEAVLVKALRAPGAKAEADATRELRTREVNFMVMSES